MLGPGVHTETRKQSWTVDARLYNNVRNAYLLAPLANTRFFGFWFVMGQAYGQTGSNVPPAPLSKLRQSTKLIRSLRLL